MVVGHYDSGSLAGLANVSQKVEGSNRAKDIFSLQNSFEEILAHLLVPIMQILKSESYYIYAIFFVYYSVSKFPVPNTQKKSAGSGQKLKIRKFCPLIQIFDKCDWIHFHFMRQRLV